MSAQRPVYRLELQALPDPRPPARRLAMLLKALLRSGAFRCLRAEELPPAPVVAPGPPAPAAGSACAPPPRGNT